jgi:uncharacterized protein (TIGR01244 family)
VCDKVWPKITCITSGTHLNYSDEKNLSSPAQVSALSVITACRSGIYLGGLQLFGNFHEVVPGEFYRSAQLRPGDIAKYAKSHGIRTVLNLRGENIEQEWYRTEIREAKEAGVGHLDFRMSMKKELTKEQVLALIDTMRKAPKPLLIHCRSGADRTGLAAAFYVAAIAKGGEEAAERQLWLHYGHIPLWFIEAAAMNRTFEMFEPYMGFEGS